MSKSLRDSKKSRNARAPDQISIESVRNVKKEMMEYIQEQLGIKGDPSADPKYKRAERAVDARIQTSRELLLAARDNNLKRVHAIVKGGKELYLQIRLNNGMTALHFLLASSDTLRDAVTLLESDSDMDLLRKDSKGIAAIDLAIHALKICRKDAAGSAHKEKFCKRLAEACKLTIEDEEGSARSLALIQKAMTHYDASVPSSLNHLRRTVTRKRRLSTIHENNNNNAE